jgi:hypothetical protein
MLELKLIGCPVDFSEFSVRAYRHGLSLAEHYRAKLVAQHIVEIWRYPSATFAASARLYDEFCEALVARGSSGTKAVCTLARKLVPMLLVLMQSKLPFDVERWRANRRQPEVA